MKPKVGDKVKLKANKVRGVVEQVNELGLQVRLDSGSLVFKSESEITNFSLAARRAWENMPNRRVGRPKGTIRTDRISVTLRIDRELWEAFREAEDQGQINDRTATINEWLAEKLRALK